MDIRSILTKYRIEWKDKGPNCSRGWINIQCPLCMDDPSQHLRISEEATGWYCLRNAKHKGGGLSYLFTKLKIPQKELDRIDTKQIEYRPPSKADKSYSEWKFFDSAENNSMVLSYLNSRKFVFPQEVCNRFSLKFSPNGKWAGRVLIPLTTGWTGRAIFGHLEPRYLSHTDESGFFLYGSGKTAFLVEGPIDAMKLAVSVEGYVYIAMTGGRLSPTILYTLRERKIDVVHAVTDNNVPLSQRADLVRELRAYLPFAEIRNTFLPRQFKDSGEMSESEARSWIYSL